MIFTIENPKELCANRFGEIYDNKMRVYDVKIDYRWYWTSFTCCCCDCCRRRYHTAANVWIIIKSVKQLTYIFHNHTYIHCVKYYGAVICTFTHREPNECETREARRNNIDSSVSTKCLLRHAWFIVACWRCRYFGLLLLLLLHRLLFIYVLWMRCDANRLLLISLVKTTSPLLYAHPYSLALYSSAYLILLDSRSISIFYHIFFLNSQKCVCMHQIALKSPLGRFNCKCLLMTVWKALISFHLSLFLSACIAYARMFANKCIRMCLHLMLC